MSIYRPLQARAPTMITTNKSLARVPGDICLPYPGICPFISRLPRWRLSDRPISFSQLSYQKLFMPSYRTPAPLQHVRSVVSTIRSCCPRDPALPQQRSYPSHRTQEAQKHPPATYLSRSVRLRRMCVSRATPCSTQQSASSHERGRGLNS